MERFINVAGCLARFGVLCRARCAIDSDKPELVSRAIARRDRQLGTSDDFESPTRAILTRTGDTNSLVAFRRIDGVAQSVQRVQRGTRLRMAVAKHRCRDFDRFGERLRSIIKPLRRS